MQTVNMHEAKTHLSKLIDKAVKGEPFIIAKAGKPLVKVMPLDAPESAQIKKIGFMKNQIIVPNDFDEMGQEEIEKRFSGQK